MVCFYFSVSHQPEQIWRNAFLSSHKSHALENHIGTFGARNLHSPFVGWKENAYTSSVNYQRFTSTRLDLVQLGAIVTRPFCVTSMHPPVQSKRDHVVSSRLLKSRAKARYSYLAARKRTPWPRWNFCFDTVSLFCSKGSGGEPTSLSRNQLYDL